MRFERTWNLAMEKAPQIRPSSDNSRPSMTFPFQPPMLMRRATHWLCSKNSTHGADPVWGDRLGHTESSWLGPLAPARRTQSVTSPATARNAVSLRSCFSASILRVPTNRGTACDSYLALRRCREKTCWQCLTRLGSERVALYSCASTD